MMGALSTDTYLPSFPAMAKEFGVGIDLIQQTLTVYLLAMAVMMLFHGTLSDSVGRVPVVLAALGLYLIASIGAIFAPNLEILLACRGLQGLTAGAGGVIGRAMVRDLFDGPEAQRMMAYITVVFCLGPVLAPIIGGWLEVTFGWRSVFVFLTLFAGSLLAACLLSLRESLPTTARAPLHLGATLQGYWTALKHRRFILKSLAIALASSTVFLYVSAAPVFVLHILALPETAFAWLFIPLIIGIMGGSLLSGLLAHRWRAEKIIGAGYALILISVLSNVCYTALAKASIPWAVIPIMLGSLGLSLASPAMTLQTLDLFPSRRGMAASLQSAILTGAFSLYAGWLAPLLFGSAFLLACGVAGCLILSIFFWWLATRPGAPA